MNEKTGGKGSENPLPTASAFLPIRTIFEAKPFTPDTMNCLIVAATAAELQPFIGKLNTRRHSGNIDVDILLTGVGLVSATWKLSQQFHLRRPDMAIQAGIAGAFVTDLRAGTVVAVRRDRVGDEGVMENGRFRNVSEMGFASPDQFPFKEDWLVNPNRGLLSRTGLPSVSAVSVNQVTTSPEMIKEYRRKFKPEIESMEGAAFHYACLMAGVPFLQLRAISNHVGDRNKNHWKIGESIRALNKELQQLLSQL